MNEGLPWDLLYRSKSRVIGSEYSSTLYIMEHNLAQEALREPTLIECGPRCLLKRGKAIKPTSAVYLPRLTASLVLYGKQCGTWVLG